jgi:hypothetical protein
LERDQFSLTLATVKKALERTISNKDFLQGWIDHMTDLEQYLAKSHEAVAMVMRSPEYTPVGRDARKRALQAELQKRLEVDRQHLAGYDSHVSMLKSRAAKAREAGSELSHVLDYLRGQELRGEIRKLDPLTLRAEYEARSADTSGRYDAWLRAVEEAPDELLPGEVLDRGKASRALRDLDPKTRQTLADLSELRNAHAHFITLVEAELPADDPIARAAAGPSAPDDGV